MEREVMQENQKMSCPVMQYRLVADQKLGCTKQLCLGNWWWTNPDQVDVLVPGCALMGASLELGPSHLASCGACGSEVVLASGCFQAFCAL